MDFETLKNIPCDYDSPINILISDLSEQIAQKTDDGVTKAVINAGFNIDKDKLVQALQQDKERYTEGYRKGYTDGYMERENEIVRCKDCASFAWNSISQNAGSCMLGIGTGHNKWHSKEWFCANGVRKEEEHEE